MSIQAHHPHDTLYKRAFVHRSLVKAHLKATLPSELVTRVDWRGLRRADPSSFDIEYRARLADRLYTVPLKGPEPVSIWLIYEHKGWADFRTENQVLRYLMNSYADHRVEQGQKTRLPVGILIVLQHGRHKRTRAGPGVSVRRFCRQYEVPSGLTRVLSPLWLDVGFVVDDLRQQSETEIAKRVKYDPLIAVLWALKHQGHVPQDRWAAWIALYRRLVRNKEIDILDMLLQYLTRQLAGCDEPNIVTELKREIAMANKIAKSYQQMWYEEGLMEGKQRGKAQGLKEGKSEGLSEGLAEGRRKGMTEVLLAQLRARFNRVPRRFLQEIREASEATLGQWSLRLIEAENIEAVFEPPSHGTR